MSTHEAVQIEKSVILATAEPNLQAMGADVRDHGDIFDRTAWLRRRPGAGITAMIGAGFIGATESQILDPYNFLMSIVLETPYNAAIVGTVVGASKVAKSVSRHQQVARYEKRLELPRMLRERTGLELEVFRDKKTKALDMAWYADEVLPAEGVSRALGSIRSVAEEMDVEHITIAKELVDDYLDTDVNNRAVTRNEWLAERKKRRGWSNTTFPVHGTDGNKKVVSLTRDELLAAEERAKLGTEREPLDSLMRVLQHVQPHHPSLRYYSVEAGTLVDNRRLERSLRMAIERRLTDVEPQFFMDEDTVRHRQKIHLSGQPRLGGDDTVLADWTSNATSLWHRTDDLLREMKIDQTGLGEMLRNWESYSPQKIIELCELASWMTVKGAVFELPMDTALKPEGSGEITDTEYVHSVGLQQRTGRVLFLNRKKEMAAEREHDVHLGHVRAYRLLRSLGGLVTAGLLTFVGTAVVDRHFDSTPAHSFGFDQWIEFRVNAVLNPQAEFDAQRDKVLEWLGVKAPSPYRGGFSGDREHQFQTAMDSLVQENAFVGNVESSSKNSAVWNIHSFNGMDATGYWTDNIFDTLSDAGGHGSSSLSWGKDSTGDVYATYKTNRLVSSDKLDPAQDKLLRVSGAVNFQTDYAKDCEPYGKDIPYADIERCWALQVPVLNGTHIVAARIAGHEDAPTWVSTQPDGRQVLFVPNTITGQGRLEYWLAPGAEDASKIFSGTKLFFEKSVDNPASFEVQNAHSGLVLEQGLETIWRKDTGQRLPDDPAERLAFEETYIQSKFDYALAPFDGRLPASYEKFAEEVLTIKQANCNIANSLLALGNPNQLLAVAGYANSDAGTENLPPDESQISLHEAHLWTIDKAGEVHDATPSSGMSEKDQEFFKEKYENAQTAQEKKQQRWEEMKRYLLGGGILAAASGSWAARKKLTSAGQRIQRKAGKAYLRSIPAVKLAHSYDTLSHALWAPDGVEFESTLKPIERGKTLQDLAQYAQNGKTATILSQLKQTPGSKTYRTNLRRARRVLKALRLNPIDE